MSYDVVKLFLFHFWLQLAKFVALFLLRIMSTYNHVKLLWTADHRMADIGLFFNVFLDHFET